MTSFLPVNWEDSALEEIANIIQGQSPPGSSYNNQGMGLPFFQGKAEFGDLYPTIVKWCTLPKKEAYPDDILISIRAPVGPTNLANVHCAIGRGLAAIRPMGTIPSKFILYYFRYSNAVLSEQATGSTFKAISGKQLREFPVLLPPLGEQHRIVNKIELLFSELDKGVSELKKAREMLASYRQSLLKAAFEGRLTEKWRKDHAGELEPANQLLARIKAEREKRYQQQVIEWKQALKDWEAQGKPGRKPTKPRKLKNLHQITKAELAGLPKLPEGWGWVRFGELIYRIEAGKSFKCYEQPPQRDQVGVAKVSAVTWGEFDENESKTCIDPNKINEAYIIKKGDFLFSRANTIELVGACVIVKSVNRKIMLSDKTLKAC